MMEFLDLPQMQRALWIALLAGPTAALLGVFVTLRRMAFFADAVAHASMTGVTLGFILQLGRDAHSPGVQLGLLVFCLASALVMAWFFERTNLHADTVIALFFTGSVAFGVIMIARLRGYRVLEGALFGNILAAGSGDVWLIAGLAVAIVWFVGANLRALALTAVQEGLARVEGHATRTLDRWFVVLLAVFVALLMQQVGALLVSALLVVPAAAARLVAPSFRAMLLLATLFGTLGGVGGIVGSYHFDAPTGPAIVMANVILLLVALLVGGRRAFQPGRGR